MKIIITISLFVLIFAQPLPVRAEIWYDKLPASGEYIPPSESTMKTPKDFIDINSSTQTGSRDYQQNDNTSTPSGDLSTEQTQGIGSSDQVVVTPESTNSVSAWLLVLLALIGFGAVVTFVWKRRPQ